MTALYSAPVSNPFDADSRLVYADWLEEQGQLANAEYERKFARALQVCDLKAAFDSLAKANGKRRTRILSESDVVDCILSAAQEDGNGYSWDAGTTVANAYRYPAIRTVCVAARRSDGSVKVGIATGNAQKGSSPISPVVPGARRDSTLPDTLSRWANS